MNDDEYNRPPAKNSYKMKVKVTKREKGNPKTDLDEEERYKWANMSSQEIKQFTREEIHENYKKVMKEILFDFYIAAGNHFGDNGPCDITYAALRDYIDKWAEIKFRPARDDWNPYG